MGAAQGGMAQQQQPPPPRSSAADARLCRAHLATDTQVWGRARRAASTARRAARLALCKQGREGDSTRSPVLVVLVACVT